MEVVEEAELSEMVPQAAQDAMEDEDEEEVEDYDVGAIHDHRYPLCKCSSSVLSPAACLQVL